MFATKLEVDRHVENCLRKINSETERNLRCLAFAKLYFKIGEYEQARRYVSSYLSSKPLSAEGQLILGKVLEKLGKKDVALEAYRSSYELDPKQNNLVIKICELLASDNINLDVSTAKYFCEKAQAINAHHPSVFTLKQRLVAFESKDPSEVTRFLLNELETRPTDVKLRISLLRHFLQNNQIKEAYKHASDIEERNLSIFINNLSWYEIVAEVLVRYQRDVSNNLGYEFWMLLINVLDKVTSLTLDEHSDHAKTNTDCVAAVFNFDQTLTLATQHLSTCNDRHLMQEFLCHYRGQLCFHLSVLMYKQAKKDLLKFKEVVDIVLPLLFIAYHSQPADLNSLWLKHTSESKKEQMKRWHREAAYRCSQVGHIILAGVKERKSTIVEKALLHSSGLWRQQLFKKLFVTREQQNGMNTSYFVNCPQIADVVIKVPVSTELQLLDDEAQLIYPDSLHHYIWLCLNQELNTFKCTSFSGLQYSAKDLKNCAAETLSILDIQAFIYCAALCAKASVEHLKDIHYNGNNKPSILPAAITEHLGTIDQAKWLVTAYRMYRNEHGADLTEIRLRLIKGLEVIRCVGNHGLHVKLLVILANTFVECAKTSTKQSEIEGNENRAELYWKTALPLLEKLKNNKPYTPNGQRLFDYKTKDMTLKEVLTHIDSGKLFIASQLMKQKEHEKALQLLEHLKDPYASYYQAIIYKAMAEEQLNQNKNNVTLQMQNQYIILLTKARDCLYLTLDRLRDPSVDRKHVLNTKLGNEIEEVEHALARSDSDILNQNESQELADESESITGGVDNFAPNYSASQSSFLNGSLLTIRNDSQLSFSTPGRRDLRREARPSPERLDAQLRQLIASKDTAISQMMDQNRIIVDAHRCLVDELKSFREAVRGLTSAVGELQTIKHTVEELKGIKDVVEELKTSVDELQSFRNVTDVVYEMKKEISELKKDSHKVKSAQLSDEDLYPLDEEFGNDYNIGSAVAGFNPNIYPQGRIPGTGSFAYGPPALYSPMYQMAPYHYGLGLPQAGGLPFGAEQIAAELRAMNTLPQNLGQNSLAQGNYAQSLLLPTLGQPFAQTPSANLLPNQSAGAQLFKETRSEQTIASAASLQSTNVFSTIPVNTFPLSSTSSTIKSAPVNVVITASDPLPTSKTTTSQPILSVTIPPQHLKGNLPPKTQPHNYQIPLPAASVATVSTPSVLNQATLPVSTQNILSNVAPPVYSAIPEKSPGKSAGLGLQIEKSLSQSFSSQPELSKSNVSASSTEEVDPCPDFKPIIPLPAEVPVNTGEENEKVLFCERAKLLRYVDKEWRERGIGNIKILHNPETNKVRIIMRREQIHKICANHFITKGMSLSPMPSNDRAYIWAANDYADQQMVLEKFCVRFKTSEQATQFYNAFQDALKLISDTNKSQTTSAASRNLEVSKPVTTATAATFGGFVFTSTPTFKPKDDSIPVKETTVPVTPKPSPFADFSFGNKTSTPTLLSSFGSDFTPVQKPVASPLNKDTSKILPSSPAGDDQSVTEFEPKVDFKPVIPLPAIVDVKTGEENAEVLHESRAKLLRYDTNTKEWKERGIGNMKILKEDKIIRLLMRREVVLKVCCNHQLLKNMEFSKLSNTPTAISWCAQDFSEETTKTEMFALRFKNEERTNEFLDALHAAQALLSDNNLLQDKLPEKKEERNQHAKVKTEPEKLVDSSKQSSWGDRFKPKCGSWNCKTCFVVNEGKDNYCVACETPKNDSLPKKEISDASGPTFSFKVPSFTSQPDSTTEQSKTGSVIGFGDKFKPKAGSWSCKTCLVVNDGDKLYCVSCESPKDETVPKKEPSKGINLSTPGKTFTFGIPQTAATSNAQKFSFVTQSAQPSSQFTFAVTPTTTDSQKSETVKPFAFIPPEQIASVKTDDKQEIKETNTEKFVFGSPQKHSFEFTPRSPRKLSGGHGDEESDGSYVEEEADNIYFKPVIPLPDKVEVKTGEEGEEVLYCHRAKLFRFADGEWKERGLGDVKILLHPETKKLRVIMRREQVLKICLNHMLTPDIEYRPKDDKTWLFCAPDFSEGEIDHQKFCLRFKTGEVAQDFKKSITNALQKITDKNESEAENKADSEVEVIFETKVTPEEEKEAVRLGLPPKFFAYKQLPDCKCEQCKKDDIYLKDLYEETPKTQASSFLFGTPSSVTSSSLFGTPKSASHLTSAVSPFLTPTTSSFTTNSPLTFTPVTSNNISQSSAIERLLVKPSILGSANISTTETSKDQTPNAFKSFTFTLNPSTTSTTASVFNTSDKPIFGGGPFAFGVKTTSVFGNPAATTSNLFGLASSTSSSATSLFGTTTTSASSIFGSSANLFSSSNTSLFGSNLSKTSDSTFGTPSTPADNQNKVASIFGSKQSGLPSFGSIATQEKSNSSITAPTEKEVILPSDPSLTFASLAASSQDKPVFGKKTDDEKNPFGFLGAGAPVFGAATNAKHTSKKVENEQTASGDEGESDGNEEYDPHYEPIVPLPAAIVVTTGEEEETLMFNERAKLYRYDADSKEWKERGVGQMKLLYHPINNTYRLLLRREQVHKVVLNQLIAPTINLTPLSLSDKAWCWGGCNYTDEGSSLEKLAVRFKTTELAKQFFDAVQNAIVAIKEYQANKSLPSTIQNYGIEDVSGDENQPVIEEADDDDDDDDDDDEDDRSVMFTKRCTLSELLDTGAWKTIAMGDLQVYYDPELYGAKIAVNDDTGLVVSNTIIGINTVMEINENECWWRAVEWANEEFQWKTLKATFSSAAAAEEFYCSYKEGVNYAQECDIVDEIPTEHSEVD